MWTRSSAVSMSPRSCAGNSLQKPAGTTPAPPSSGAGFTSARPWLGINHNCAAINLAGQEGDEDSIWSWYKDLSALRREREVLRQGEFVPLEAGRQVFAYRRELGEERLTVALNFSDDPAQVSLDGQLLRSNYRRERFEGILQPWEAVILE